jgi:hypothetical protein
MDGHRHQYDELLAVEKAIIHHLNEDHPVSYSLAITRKTGG